MTKLVTIIDSIYQFQAGQISDFREVIFGNVVLQSLPKVTPKRVDMLVNTRDFRLMELLSIFFSNLPETTKNLFTNENKTSERNWIKRALPILRLLRKGLFGDELKESFTKRVNNPYELLEDHDVQFRFDTSFLKEEDYLVLLNAYLHRFYPEIEDSFFSEEKSSSSIELTRFFNRTKFNLEHHLPTEIYQFIERVVQPSYLIFPEERDNRSSIPQLLVWLVQLGFIDKNKAFPLWKDCFSCISQEQSFDYLCYAVDNFFYPDSAYSLNKFVKKIGRREGENYFTITEPEEGKTSKNKKGSDNESDDEEDIAQFEGLKKIQIRKRKSKDKELPENKGLFTKSKVSRIFAVSRDTIRKYCKNGAIEQRRKGKRNLIPLNDSKKTLLFFSNIIAKKDRIKKEKNIIQEYAESKNIKISSARRWFFRMKKKGFNLDEIERMAKYNS